MIARNIATASARNNLAARTSVQVRKKWQESATGIANADCWYNKHDYGLSIWTASHSVLFEEYREHTVHVWGTQQTVGPGTAKTSKTLLWFS